jgi:hypothetical protein
MATTTIPKVLLEYSAKSVKDGGEPVLRLRLIGHEGSPEPPEPTKLPDESSNNEVENTQIMEALIKHIQESDPAKNPFIVLGVTLTNDFKKRIADLKRDLQKYIGKIDSAGTTLESKFCFRFLLMLDFL